MLSLAAFGTSDKTLFSFLRKKNVPKPSSHITFLFLFYYSIINIKSYKKYKKITKTHRLAWINLLIAQYFTIYKKIRITPNKIKHIDHTMKSRIRTNNKQKHKITHTLFWNTGRAQKKRNRKKKTLICDIWKHTADTAKIFFLIILKWITHTLNVSCTITWKTM